MNKLPEFVLKALEFGVLGLCAITLILVWRVLQAEQKREGYPRQGILQASYVFMAFSLALAVLISYVQLSEQVAPPNTAVRELEQSHVLEVQQLESEIKQLRNEKESKSIGAEINPISKDTSIKNLIEAVPPKIGVRFIPGRINLNGKLWECVGENCSSCSSKEYVFIADYAEIKGLTVSQAAEKLGVEGSADYTVVIFDLFSANTSLFVRPASSKGILKKVKRLNSEIGRNYPLPNNDSNLLNDLNSPGYPSYALTKWKPFQEQYEKLVVSLKETPDFKCDFSSINEEWYHLGYVMDVKRGVTKFVEGNTFPWYGTRAFLAKNLTLSKISHKVVLYVSDGNYILPEFSFMPINK